MAGEGDGGEEGGGELGLGGGGDDGGDELDGGGEVGEGEGGGGGAGSPLLDPPPEPLPEDVAFANRITRSNAANCRPLS